MEKKRLSIIIPVHNSERYLHECLESILCQIEVNDEIILIDDASTDNSLSLCRNYEKNYSKLIHVVEKECQSGPSDSRNIGTRQACGCFICYVDSDDWLAPDALNVMFQYAIENCCEIVQSGFYYAYSDYLLLDKRVKKTYPIPQTISNRQAMDHLVKDGIVNNFIWGKLYKAELAKAFSFPVDVSMGEDLYWQHRVVDSAKNIGILPEPQYYYRQNSLGLSYVFSERHITLLYALEDRLAFVKNRYPELFPEMLYWYWKQAYQMSARARMFGDDICKQVFDNYWKKLNRKYQSDLDSHICRKIEYRLYHYSGKLLWVYLLAKRVKGRFSSDFQRISVK